MNTKKLKKILLFAVIMLLVTGTAYLFARAGGGGSRSRSGGGGDLGILYLVFYIIRILPFPLNIIAIGILLFLFFKGSKKVKNDGSAFSNIGGIKDSAAAEGFTDFLIHNPEFNEEAFIKKVETAFIGIQKAWTEKKIAQARRYITDGVYQRFLTQIKMMELLKQTDEISDIRIINIWIDRVEEDGDYDIIHAGIHASMKDVFRSELSKSLNIRVDDDFIEYWSFIRKKNSRNKDLYGTVKCPNCNAPLTEKNLDVVKCPFCGTLLNNGEYDWILSEITQANDYVSSKRSIRKIKRLVNKLSGSSILEGSSVQLLEDKASNGYLQILTAKAVRDFRGIRRFTSSAFAERLEKSMEDEIIVYNRLFLNDVTLIGTSETGESNILFISIRSSFQRVMLKDGKLARKIDPFLVSETNIVVMKKKKNARKPKGSLYAGSCPACGAPVEDPFAVKCSFCGTEYNREDLDWIIDNILTMEEYAEYSSDSDATALNPDIIDSVYDVRDYAMNNIMMIIGADGVFESRERELAVAAAKKFGYKPDILEPLFKQAASGRLSIKMPESRKKRTRIYSLMVKAAMADDNLGIEEKELLDAVKEKYLSA